MLTELDSQNAALQIIGLHGVQICRVRLTESDSQSVDRAFRITEFRRIESRFTEFRSTTFRLKVYRHTVLRIAEC